MKFVIELFSPYPWFACIFIELPITRTEHKLILKIDILQTIKCWYPRFICLDKWDWFSCVIFHCVVLSTWEVWQGRIILVVSLLSSSWLPSDSGTMRWWIHVYTDPSWLCNPTPKWRFEGKFSIQSTCNMITTERKKNVYNGGFSQSLIPFPSSCLNLPAIPQRSGRVQWERVLRRNNW